ncbi:hypothetical protein T440DRAFT_320788 [Plenodomus tracheiphilus IPT5]|uniref:Uncharacterized protein n=1 Tax=Plenodomus tracheiphilus IPT5 TaxID=1408161 RepID=A0A6A7BCP8_9PLEO|nr:hypothetical protein T440DRAFT_320788 [Plenodomus tracheiphilus IPT5]
MRLKTLNGAPLCEHLDFSDNNLLSDGQCRSFLATLELDASVSESTLPLKWRCITHRATRLQTGWSQPYLPESSTRHDGADITLSMPNVAETSHYLQDDTTNLDDTIILDDPSLQTDDFLHQSLIFHNALLSSQVLPNSETDSFVSPSSFMDTSFATTTSYDSPSRVDEHTILLQVPPRMIITSLGSLPTAQRLSAMYPQTPTPNFVCVLTASPVQREIFVPKGGYTCILWEIFVADETRSGFKVNFWIQPPRKSNDHHTHAQEALRQVLGSIKIGDILLLRNIALNSFRDTVYGQSLSATFSRARSSLDILMKSNGVEIAHTGGLPTTAVEAFLRVRRWARTHVASETIGARKRRGSASSGGQPVKRTVLSQDFDNSLPPDTMESV